MFYYTAFGLVLESEFEFPELTKLPQQVIPDVKIRFGNTPKSIENASFSDGQFWITPTQCLQHIDMVAWYFAENGRTVTVDACPGADLKSLRIYLLCSSMAAIVHQRHMIPLHASGILTPKGVSLIIGDSGAGKSTTVKALSGRGHKIFTDDVCVLRKNEEGVEGVPSYPVMKLWGNSFQLLKLGNISEEDRLWQEIEKYGLYFHDEFISEWKSISSVFILEISETTNLPSIKQLTGTEAFVLLGSNTYRGWYIEPMKLNTLHFQVINQLIQQTRIYNITRPLDANSVDTIVSLIENNI